MKGLEVPPREDDFTADPVELFFDLTYVYAFSQLVYVLVHDPTWAGVGQVVLLFAVMWIPWMQFHWSANAVSGNDRRVRAWFLVATVAAIPMGASIATAFDEGGPVFAISSAVILAMALVTMIVGLDDDAPEAANIRWFARPIVTAIVILVGGSFLPATPRAVAWIVAVLTVALGGMLRAGDREWIVRAGHFAERHGLIVIVALGEVVVATGLAVNEVLAAAGEGEATNPTAITFTTLVAAATFAGLLWWSYFDRPSPAWEHAAEGLDRIPRGAFARDVWSSFHLPIVLGIVFTAAAVEEIALHPAEPVPLAFRLMFAAGLAGFVGGILGAVGRAFRLVGTDRLVGLAVAVAVLLLGAPLPGLAHLVAVDLVLALTLATEEVRKGRSSEPDPIHASHG